MGGTPLVAVNLLAWPRDKDPLRRRGRCCGAAPTSAPRPATHLAGGHSIDDPEPKYGLAVTGLADPDRLLRNDAGAPGTPLTLTKPLGLGVLNNRHKATGERFEEAVAVMTPSTGRPRGRARRGRRLRHRRHRLRPARPPLQAGAGERRDGGRRRGRGALRRTRARSRVAAGFVPGRQPPQPRLGAAAPRRPVGEDELVLLADAQTSGGLLVAGELPGTRSSASWCAASPARGSLTPRVVRA